MNLGAPDGETLTTGRGLIRVGPDQRHCFRARIKQQLGTAYPRPQRCANPCSMSPRCASTGPSSLTTTSIQLWSPLESTASGANGSRRPSTRLRQQVAARGLRHRLPADAHTDLPAATRTTGRDRPDRRLLPGSHRHAGPKFLWNAKMRFGKTFATYELARRWAGSAFWC